MNIAYATRSAKRKRPIIDVIKGYARRNRQTIIAIVNIAYYATENNPS